MKKDSYAGKYFWILLILISYGCSEKIQLRSEPLLFPSESRTNKFIGNEKLETEIKGIKYFEKFINDEYLALEGGGQFIVFENKEKGIDYFKDIPVYKSPNDRDEYFLGIYCNWLFFGGGTSPGTHMLKILDLKKRSVIFEGAWLPISREIVFIDDFEVLVYRHIGQKRYIDEHNDIFKARIEAYNFNLKTNYLMDLGYSIAYYGQ